MGGSMSEWVGGWVGVWADLVGWAELGGSERVGGSGSELGASVTGWELVSRPGRQRVGGWVGGSGGVGGPGREGNGGWIREGRGCFVCAKLTNTTNIVASACMTSMQWLQKFLLVVCRILEGFGASAQHGPQCQCCCVKTQFQNTLIDLGFQVQKSIIFVSLLCCCSSCIFVLNIFLGSMNLKRCSPTGFILQFFPTMGRFLAIRVVRVFACVCMRVHACVLA